MATSLQVVYDAFLSRITADDWMNEEDLFVVQRDWRQILENAIFRFKYPRVDLTIENGNDRYETDYFKEDLTHEEIHLLALYMKHEWVKRCVSSWENIRSLYSDLDFSQANFLDKLNKLEANVALEIRDAESIYDRSRNKRPASLFKKLAGKNNLVR